jgi:hypothetical protein
MHLVWVCIDCGSQLAINTIFALGGFTWLKMRSNVELREVNRLEVTAMTAMSSLRTSIGCGSVVSVTRVVPSSATCRICLK